jgi:hypothetical protein
MNVIVYVMCFDSVVEETRIFDPVRHPLIQSLSLPNFPSFSIPHSYLHNNLAGLFKMARSTSVQALLGADTFEKVKNTKILVVGAGGIGCELRKSSTRADEVC